MIFKLFEIVLFIVQIFVEILYVVGVLVGVFNFIQGDGFGVGEVLFGYFDIDMIIFIGFIRVGVEIVCNVVYLVKCVIQELGGKSFNIILDDEVFVIYVVGSVVGMMVNLG